MPPASDPSAPGAPTPAKSDESLMIERLRAADNQAFLLLVERHQAAMLRVASLYVHDQTVAEEVVQETWIGVLRGLDRFEGRSSLKTWIFSILVNQARAWSHREGRYVTPADFS